MENIYGKGCHKMIVFLLFIINYFILGMFLILLNIALYSPNCSNRISISSYFIYGCFIIICHLFETYLFYGIYNKIQHIIGNDIMDNRKLNIN